MKSILITILTLTAYTVTAQRGLYESAVFSSEPQNRMISRVPKLLLEAYRNGDVPAYYPKAIKTPVPYHQFLAHFVGGAQAVNALQAGPDWFCDRRLPALDQGQLSCFSDKFLLFKINTTEKAKEHVYVQLIQTGDCAQAGYDRPGPIFRVTDIARLTSKVYPLVNPQNGAVTYSINDALLLHLYADRQRVKD